MKSSWSGSPRGVPVLFALIFSQTHPGNLEAALKPSPGRSHNYAEVLQKSMFFYEAQRAGYLPEDHRISWRGDSAIWDGADVGLDLTGGWFDAGDHVKFNFPMAFTATALAWGYLESPTAYQQSGQERYLLDNLRWVTDYLLKCHTAPNELYAQVGNGDEDHCYWVPAEVIHIRSARPAYKIDAAHPGTELAAETAAALASASLVFKASDPAYSRTLLEHAVSLYSFADTYRGEYSKVVPVGAFYKSWSGYQDELVWGAIWLYLATQDLRYLDKAVAEYELLSNEQQTSVKSYGWTLCWDDKSYGAYVLLAKITGQEKYKQDAERHLEQWFVSSASDGKGPQFTPAGFPILSPWGNFRYAANSAFLLQVYSDITEDPLKRDRYRARAREIIDYLLGDNPQKTSYVIGYGKRYPMYPHHRTAHGPYDRNEDAPVETRHVLYGALVGGHKIADDLDWTDSRHDYYWNEVATDYNALFTGAVARLTRDHGGTALPGFPPEEIPSDEFFAESKLNASGKNFTEPAIWIHNHSAWPAHPSDQLSLRYFIDISEGVRRGFAASAYTVRLNYGPGLTVSQLLPWDERRNLYYVEVSFFGQWIYPGGQSECRREAQFRILAPEKAAWDPTNDWSYAGLSSTLTRNERIAVYDAGQRVFGQVPPLATSW